MCPSAEEDLAWKMNGVGLRRILRVSITDDGIDRDPGLAQSCMCRLLVFTYS